MERVPLFPLGLVLLPRMPLPLHIFEERYRLMVRHCMDTGEPFGILLLTGTTIQNVGCLAAIEHVVNTYDDGRSDILTVGTERFRTRAIYEQKSYLEADIEIFRDAPDSGSPDDLDALRNEALTHLKDFASHSGYTVDENFLQSLELEELSFLLATTDVFSLEERQQLLELQSTRRRLEIAATALSESSRRRTMASAIRQILGKDDSEDINHFFN